jgi:hypothetical protein
MEIRSNKVNPGYQANLLKGSGNYWWGLITLAVGEQAELQLVLACLPSFPAIHSES